MENALEAFEKLEHVRSTKTSALGFIMGQLWAKLACVDAELALESDDRDRHMLTACQV